MAAGMAEDPPLGKNFFTNRGFVNEQRVPGYVYALVPV
jgi:hypothetical protein